MSALKVNGTFISEKVSRVRWIPEQYTAPNAFLTGSWEAHRNSAIKLWRLTADSDFADDDGTASQSAVHAADASLVPKCTAKLPFSGDTTGMAFIDGDHVVVSSSDGFASVLQLNRQTMQLHERNRYARLHGFGADSRQSAGCTALSAYEHNVCTVGEDGRLNVINVNNAGVLRSIADVDSCSLTAVAFVSAAEVFTGNRMGTIKMFDVRVNDEARRDDDRQYQQQQRPVATMLISCDDEKKPNAVTALTCHPTQRHILLAGSEEGSITVWDLRMMADAASYLTAHETAISELAFHPTAPNRLFTAAEGGELFEWSHVVGGVATARVLGAPTATAEGPADQADQANPWLSGERIKNKISVSMRCI